MKRSFLIEQKWANLFKNDHEFKLIENYYQELRSKGIDFPVVDETKVNINIINHVMTINILSI